MGQPAHTTLVIACGALAKEIVNLRERTGANIDLRCLPAGFHNTPDRIVPGVEAILEEVGSDYDRVLIGYGDCGTGGGLDRLLADHPKAERLDGAHCYAVYAGLGAFDDMMEEELGSFFLTDYIVRHFDTLIIKGMGLDRFPELRDTYFKHYKRVVYISQDADAALLANARAAAVVLGLSFEHRAVGYGNLSDFIASASRETVHA